MEGDLILLLCLLQLKELEEQLKRKEQERKENARRMRDDARQV